jgi:hypothetical protein
VWKTALALDVASNVAFVQGQERACPFAGNEIVALTRRVMIGKRRIKATLPSWPIPVDLLILRLSSVLPSIFVDIGLVQALNHYHRGVADCRH